MGSSLPSSGNPTQALFRVARPHFWALPVLVVLGVAASLAEGIGIGLLIPALDAVIQSSTGDAEGPFGEAMRALGQRIPEGYALPMLGAAILALVIIKTVILVLEAVVSTRVVSRITRDLRVSLARQLLEVGMAYHAREEQGRLVNAMDTQTWRTSEGLRTLAILIGSSSTVLVFTALLFLLSWHMALIALATAIPVTILIRLLSIRARGHGRHMVEAHSLMAGRIIEILAAMRTIRLFGQEPEEARRFDESADELKQAHIKSDTLVAILPSVAELAYMPVFIAVLGYAFHAGTGISVVLAFLLVLYRLQAPLKMANTARVNISNLAEGVAEIERILDRSDKPYVVSGSRAVNDTWSRVAFQDVSFRYQEREGEPVLRDVSFEIPRGSRTAIVGESGAGKSTIANLICRFYEPVQGVISVDGTPLPEIDLEDWRSRLSFAGQDAELLSGSVAWNIAYGIPGAGMDDIRKVAEIACASEFIEELPDGYQTQVGARGLALSGGQRQRIAIARALLRRPQILILDEPMNALDPPTERRVLDGILSTLADDATLVLVTHRPTGLLEMDQIVVLEAGRIVQAGRPHDLRAASGTLSRLFSDPSDGSSGMARERSGRSTQRIP
jgi:ATP-binding cassette, subfamily B, bacterial MsbA